MKSLLCLLVVLLMVPAIIFSQGRVVRDKSAGAYLSRPEMKAPLVVLKKVTGTPLPAGSYTIGVGGYFPTIDSAFRRLEAGGIEGPVTLLLADTLYVAPFPPGDFRLIGPIAGAGPASRITIRPADNVAVTIEGSGTGALTFEDVSYLTLDGISLEGSTRLKVHTSANAIYDWNDAVDLWGDCNHDIVQNLTAGSDRIHPWTTAVLLMSKDSTTVDSCIVSGVSVTSGGNGIVVCGYNSINRPNGNVIRDCHVGSPTDSLIGEGIGVWTANGTRVENNRIENLQASMAANPPYLIGIESSSSFNTIIRNNAISGLRGTGGASIYGIVVSGEVTNAGDGAEVYNNMICDLQNRSTTTAGYIGGIVLWYNSNALVAFNSVSLSGTSADTTGSDALGLEVGTTKATVCNNILMNTYHITSPGGGSTALWWANGTSFTSDHNDFVVDTTFGNSWVVRGCRTLREWQGVGYDAHSVSVMPPFRGPYLHVDSTNAAANHLNRQGVAVAAVAFDFDGQPRNPASPDIGADEFTIPLPTSWGAAWTKDPPTPVLSGGAGGTWNRHVFMPCVLFNADSARYEMWFGASYGPGTPNWRPYRIGYAVSRDGISWTMHPSPVLTGDPGTWEAYSIEAPMVIREDGGYKMWYSGSPDWIVTKIGYATSPDGIHWTKYSGNPVMDLGKATWEAGGPYSCHVMPSENGFRMWYGGYEPMPSVVCRIGYATSTDGITWQRDTVNNPIVGLGSAGQWDAAWVLAPHVLQVGDAHYMWYTGSASTYGARYGGLAISNDMGKSWTKHPLNPIFRPSNGSWDGTYVELGTVMQRGDTLDMWYAGAAAPSYHWMIGHATSLLVTSVRERVGGIARKFMLFQNYPNPFNPTTVIGYQLPEASHVTLVVYDLLGREVAVLVNETKTPGDYRLKFEASGLSSGVYLYRLTAGNFVQTRKMVVLK